MTVDTSDLIRIQSSCRFQPDTPDTADFLQFTLTELTGQVTAAQDNESKVF